MKVPVDVRTILTHASVAFYPQPEVLRRPRQFRANRSDAEQPDLLAAERARRRRIPAAGLLRLVFVEHPAFVRDQIAEHVLDHERAEHATRVGEDVIAADRWGEQRLDAGPRGLHPAHVWQARERRGDERRLAQHDVALARRSVETGKIGGKEQTQVRQIRRLDQAAIGRRVTGENEERVHDQLSTANVTIERRGRKGRKERQRFLAAFAAFAFHGGVSDVGHAPHSRRQANVTPRARIPAHRPRCLRGPATSGPCRSAAAARDRRGAISGPATIRARLRHPGCVSASAVRLSFLCDPLARRCGRCADPSKSKRATTRRVMALCDFLCPVRWLHHPVNAGTRMPTLIRRRLMSRASAERTPRRGSVGRCAATIRNMTLHRKTESPPEVKWSDNLQSCYGNDSCDGARLLEQLA